MALYHTREQQAAKNFEGLSQAERTQLESANPRQQVTQREEHSDCKFVDLILRAEAFAKKWGKNLEDVKTEVTKELYEYSDSEYAVFYILVDSLETDEQYHARLWELKEQSRYREAYERKEFERLSAKFKK